MITPVIKPVMIIPVSTGVITPVMIIPVITDVIIPAGFPRLLESPGFFSLKFQDLESPGKISLENAHFSTGSN